MAGLALRADQGGRGAGRHFAEPRRFILLVMTATFSTQIEIDAQGLAWIAGTKIKVIEVVLDKISHGWSPEEIHFQHPGLSLAQIHAALTFYYENQVLLDTQIRDRFNESSQLLEQVSDPEFRRRLAGLA
jgi:uncharacterized protein (DUF433 family)